MKDKILKAAAEVLIQHGLNGWTVDSVSRKAGCAKGLINYHYRTKQDLLKRVAQSLRDRRWAERRESTSTSKALDRLWQTLIEEVDSGRFSAWLSLQSGNRELRLAATATEDQPREVARALAHSLGLGQELDSRGGLISGVLDGLELRLLQGDLPQQVEEDYHRLWLAILDI